MSVRNLLYRVPIVVVLLFCCFALACSAPTGDVLRTDAPPAEGTGAVLSSSVLFYHDFDDNKMGDYRGQWASDWRSPPWNNGVDDGRVSIVDGPEAYAGKSLQVSYPAGTYGPGPGGAQWGSS